MSIKILTSGQGCKDVTGEMQAQLEPAGLASGPQNPFAWTKVVRDVNTLLTRIAALQMLTEGELACFNPLAPLC